MSGEDEETFENPNVDNIAEKSNASLFGKGDTTAKDFEYRLGREVVAAGIGVDSAGQSNATRIKSSLYSSLKYE